MTILHTNPSLGCLVALVLTGCHAAEARPGPESSALPIVPVVTVSRADLSHSIVLTGEFQPFQEVDILAKVAGYVQTLPVDIGDRVSAGQVLATLEVPELQNELAKAKADADAAESDGEAAKDEQARAEASHEIAHLSFTRLSDVVKREPGLVPQQDLDVARTRELEAAAQLAGARSKVRAGEGHLRMAEAERARLETLCRYMRITAPFAGVVTKRYASIGTMIQAGTASQSQAMPVVRLSENTLLRLMIPIPEAEVPHVQVGQSVEVLVRALGKTFDGKVTRMAEEVQMATRTMNGEIDLPNPDLSLVPGMYADVKLRTEHSEHALVLPLDAVEGLGASPWVFRVD